MLALVSNFAAAKIEVPLLCEIYKISRTQKDSFTRISRKTRRLYRKRLTACRRIAECPQLDGKREQSKRIS